jgi:hypothetical protein
MSTAPTTTPPAERPGPVRRTARIVGRLALTVAVLWAAWVVVGSWSLLLGEADPVPKRLPDEMSEWEGAMPVELLASLPKGAAWQFSTPLKPGEKALPPLLPLPDGVLRVCLQRDNGGTVYAEIVTGVPAPQDLASHWKSAGWEVKTGRAGADGSQALLCKQGTNAVRVWVGPAADDPKERVMFLIRGEGA